MTYNAADDSKKCHALALEAMRGHAYIRVIEGSRGAEIVVHKHDMHGHEEFTAPMTRSMLLTLMAHICNALQKLRHE